MVDDPVTLLDIVPTVLDWWKVSYPHYSIFKKQGRVKLTGRSLLEYLAKQGNTDRVAQQQVSTPLLIIFPRPSSGATSCTR